MGPIEQNEAGLIVHPPTGDASGLLPWRWLRDHGEDEASLDPSTRQRRVDTFAIPDDLEPAAVDIGPDAVTITWPDNATSTISTQLLRAVTDHGPAADHRQHWTADKPPDTTGITASSLDSDDGLALLLDRIHRFGFAVVEQLDPSLASTEALATRIGPVRETVFGRIWQVESGRLDHADSAYTTEDLEPHTDGTYSHDAPGLQILHFTEQATSGGQSTLVDGLTVHRQLADRQPLVLDTLTTVDVPAHYCEPGVDLRARRPALVLDEHGRFRQISFNNYDRSPFWLEPPELDEFYTAYAALHDRIIDPCNRIEVRLTDGSALIADNWRVLHGRAGFTGRRRFQGCYLNHEDYESRRRVLS